jgi:hypothetical protein
MTLSSPRRCAACSHSFAMGTRALINLRLTASLPRRWEWPAVHTPAGITSAQPKRKPLSVGWPRTVVLSRPEETAQSLESLVFLIGILGTAKEHRAKCSTRLQNAKGDSMNKAGFVLCLAKSLRSTHVALLH